MGDSCALPLEAYRRIIEMARQIEKRTSFASSTQRHCSVQPCIPTLHLSAPPNLTSVLNEDGVPAEVSRRLSVPFMNFFETLKGRIITQYHQACAELAGLSGRDDLLPSSRLFDQLAAAFASIYDRKIEAWVAEVRVMVKNRTGILGATGVIHGRSAQKGESIESKGKDGRFNTDYVPTLEVYYAKEKFPSRADKEFLATKSGMTYRQIHIWFQNRRNRDKKIKTCGANKERTTVGWQQPRSAKPKPPPAPTTSLSRASSVTLVDEYQSFDCRSPAYAYPTTYPPAVEDGQDPFPCRFGDFSSFEKPSWSRRPTSLRHDRREEIDLDSLTYSFSQLQISHDVKQAVGEASGGTPQDLRTSSGAGCDITSPYTVRPLRAPLASLIRNCATRGEPHGSESSAAARSPRHQVVTAPVVANGAHSSRKSKWRQSHASSGLVSQNENVVPSEYPQNKTTSSSLNLSTSSAPQPPKTRRSRKKLAFSRHTAAASVPQAVQEDGKRLVDVVGYSSESPISYASPTASVSSLPSLSYSSASSSASEGSRSPTPSFVTLSDGDDLASIVTCQPGISSSNTESSQTVWHTFSSPVFGTSGFSFDFAKGPMLDLGLELPTYPSYSDSLSSMPQGL